MIRSGSRYTYAFHMAYPLDGNQSALAMKQTNKKVGRDGGERMFKAI